MFSANPTTGTGKADKSPNQGESFTPYGRRDVPSLELANSLYTNPTTDQGLGRKWGVSNKPDDTRTRAQTRQAEGKLDKGQTSKTSKTGVSMSRTTSTESKRKTSTAVKNKEAGGGPDRPNRTGGDRAGSSKNPKETLPDRLGKPSGDRNAHNPDLPKEEDSSWVQGGNGSNVESKDNTESTNIVREDSTPQLNTSDASALAVEANLLEGTTENARDIPIPPEEEEFEPDHSERNTSTIKGEEQIDPDEEPEEEGPPPWREFKEPNKFMILRKAQGTGAWSDTEFRTLYTFMRKAENSVAFEPYENIDDAACELLRDVDPKNLLFTPPPRLRELEELGLPYEEEVQLSDIVIEAAATSIND
jgi:hypothetical protein